MPRLFTGIEVPPDVSFDLSLSQGGLTGARWMQPEDYHVTLRFIGDVDHAMARDIDALLSESAPRAVEVAVESLASFGGDRPRAIIARVQPHAALVELAAEQERLMRRLGLPPETRKFAPHVTLARLRGTSASEVAAYLSLRGYRPTNRYRPARFVLYSARESVGGGPYVVEAAYPLA